MEDNKSVMNGYNQRASIDELLKAQKELRETLAKLNISSKENEETNGLNLEARKEIDELVNSLNETVSNYQTRLRTNSNDSDILARLGPLIYIIDSTTQGLNRFLNTPIAERNLDALMNQFAHLWNQSMFVTRPYDSDVNNKLWESVLSEGKFSESLSQPEPEKAGLSMGRGIGGATLSGALMVAGVMATLLGGPIGAAIGIPLFALGAIGGIASASYIGYVVRAGKSPVSPEPREDSFFIPDLTQMNEVKYRELVNERERLMVEFKLEIEGLKEAEKNLSGISGKWVRDTSQKFEQKAVSFDARLFDPDDDIDNDIDGAIEDLKSAISEIKQERAKLLPDSKAEDKPDPENKCPSQKSTS